MISAWTLYNIFQIQIVSRSTQTVFEIPDVFYPFLFPHFFSFKYITRNLSAVDQEGHLKGCQCIWFLDMIMENLMPLPFLTLK